MAEKGRLITGARARFSIEGVKVGYAQSVSLGEEYQVEEVQTLDNIEVEENVIVGYRVTFSCRFFRIINESLKSLGYMPSVGQNSEDHLANVLASGDLTATLEDTKTGKLYATVEQVKVTSRNYQTDARGLIGEDVTFSAIRIRDESEL